MLVGQVHFKADLFYLFLYLNYYPYFTERKASSFEVLVQNQQPNTTRLRWVHTLATRPIPSGAVVGGNENENALYIGRTRFSEAEAIVGKVNYGRGGLFYTRDGVEFSSDDFEILIKTTIALAVPFQNSPLTPESNTLRWVAASNFELPHYAVVGGWCRNGDVYYVGRYNGGAAHVFPGTYDSARGVLFYEFAAKYESQQYEILVNMHNRADLEWIRTSGAYVPDNTTVLGGYDTHVGGYMKLYVGRKYQGSCLIVGKVNPRDGGVYVAHDNIGKRFDDYEVLVCNEPGYSALL